MQSAGIGARPGLELNMHAILCRVAAKVTYLSIAAATVGAAGDLLGIGAGACIPVMAMLVLAGL